MAHRLGLKSVTLPLGETACEEQGGHVAAGVAQRGQGGDVKPAAGFERAR